MGGSSWSSGAAVYSFSPERDVATGFQGSGHWKEGVLGVVKAYYGCVEAQGHRTLHCHMLIWIEGGLNPDAVRDRLKSDPAFGPQLVLLIVF